MSTPRRPPASAAVAVGGLVVWAAAVLGLAPAALAHSDLVDSAPSAGSTLTEAPDEVRLLFGEDVVAEGSTVTVTDPSGARLATGAPSVQFTLLTVPLAAPAVSGEYTVAYRVISGDGDPVTGSYTFVLQLPTTTGTDDQQTSASGAPPAPGGSTWWPLSALLAVGVVVAGLLVARHRRTAGPTVDADEPALAPPGS